MARAARLAGAILAETHGAFYLVGQTKAPCDWARVAFEPPAQPALPAPARLPFVRLAPAGDPVLAKPVLFLDVEGEDLPRTLAARFLIERNGSVSERLWRLVLHGGDPDANELPPGTGEVDARWLGAIPPLVWQFVRDSVLRCV